MAPLADTIVSQVIHDVFKSLCQELFVYTRPGVSLWTTVLQVISSEKVSNTPFLVIFREDGETKTRILIHEASGNTVYGFRVTCPRPGCAGEIRARTNHGDVAFRRLLCRACDHGGRINKPVWLERFGVGWFWAPYPLPVAGWPRPDDIVQDPGKGKRDGRAGGVAMKGNKALSGQVMLGKRRRA